MAKHIFLKEMKTPQNFSSTSVKPLNTNEVGKECKRECEWNEKMNECSFQVERVKHEHATIFNRFSYVNTNPFNGMHFLAVA